MLSLDLFCVFLVMCLLDLSQLEVDFKLENNNYIISLLSAAKIIANSLDQDQFFLV